MKSRKLFGKVGVLLMIFVMATLVLVTWAQSAGVKIVKVGVIAPLTGAGAPWGHGLRDGTILAFEDLEAEGFSIDGKKVKFKFYPYDDKYIGAEAAKAATRLIQVDRVDMICGSIGSSCVQAFLPITEKAKIFTFGNSYSTRNVSPNYPYYFRICGTSTESAPHLLPYVVKKHNVKTVAILTANDESGKDLAKTSRKIYEEMGVKVAYEEYYERTQSDFYPYLNKILAFNPELIDFAASASGTQGLMTKQARELGFKGAFITCSGLVPEVTVEVGGKAADGLYYANACSMLDPRLDPFKEKFKKRFKREANSNDTFYHGGAQVIAQALRNAKSVKSDALKKAAENLGEVETVLGKVHFGGKDFYGIDHQLLPSWYMLMIKDGKESIEKKPEI